MISTSCEAIAREVLERSIAGHPPASLPKELLDESCGKALFGILVEGLADRFEPSLCDFYARLFSQAIEGADPRMLVERYQRVRRPRAIRGEPRDIYVLSRVTLGADVAVTSVLLDAARQRFPEARIHFAGPRKNYELFAGDPRIRPVPVAYHRGGLRDRLGAWKELDAMFSRSDGIVVDPDSRLTQLGLLPVCDEDRYYFFESRAYGGDGHASLAELTSAWAQETFGVAGKPYIALGAPPAAGLGAYIAVSLGVGENPAKRIADPFEEQLLAMLAKTGMPVHIDQGAGGEEAGRVRRAVERSGAEVRYWDGTFAEFAGIIAGARLYVGYDSAGQHVAAACGVPLITIFAGFPAPRMFDRWRPVGQRCRVIRVDRPEAAPVLAEVRSALLAEIGDFLL